METNTDWPTVGFINIAMTGTDLNLSDNSEVGVTLSFPLLMLGIVATFHLTITLNANTFNEPLFLN
jgi:hypothetical protein